MPFPRCAAVALIALLLTACSAATGRPAGPLRVVATTSTLASLAEGAAGGVAHVRSLVPVGVSPEDYQPTPQDIATLHDADVLVENGAGLEGWLEPTLRNARNGRLRTVVCTDGLPVVDENPHLWVDPELARGYVSRIADALVAADAAHAEAYRRSAKAYDGQLVALVARTHTKLAEIPPARRVMIIFHNAFAYYDRRFGLREIAAVEPIAGAEPNPAHIADVVELAKRYRVPAIFAEHEFNPRLAETIAKSAGGLKVAYLYDDSLGTTSNVSTYVGMIDTDTETIVDALR
jgi:ABC-type Zn uptake system ZnuABC Zn-binding protein ZnuA